MRVLIKKREQKMRMGPSKEYPENGYVYAGSVYVEHIHPIFAYRNGKWNEIVGDSDSTNGHVLGHDEDENVVVAWDGGQAITPPADTALSIAQGGTGATTAAEARTNLGLGSAATYNVVSSITDDSNLVTGGAIKAYYEAVGIPSAICTTVAGTAAKVATCSSFKLLANSYIQVIIANANTASSALTLNINSTGAKPIIINGSGSSSTNYTLPAGSYFVFYNGTNYYFRTDGKITGDITGNAATVNGHSVAKDVPSNAVFTDTTALASMTGTLPVDHGGTGATSVSGAVSALGLSNSTIGTKTSILQTSISATGNYGISNYANYNFLYIRIQGDQNNGGVIIIPKALYNDSIPINISSKNGAGSNDGTGYSIFVQGRVTSGVIYVTSIKVTGWSSVNCTVFGLK